MIAIPIDTSRIPEFNTNYQFSIIAGVVVVVGFFIKTLSVEKLSLMNIVTEINKQQQQKLKSIFQSNILDIFTCNGHLGNNICGTNSIKTLEIRIQN